MLNINGRSCVDHILSVDVASSVADSIGIQVGCVDVNLTDGGLYRLEIDSVVSSDVLQDALNRWVATDGTCALAYVNCSCDRIVAVHVVDDTGVSLSDAGCTVNG